MPAQCSLGGREDLGHRLAEDAVWGAPGNTMPCPEPPARGSQSADPGEVSGKYIIIISVNKRPGVKNDCRASY